MHLVHIATQLTPDALLPQQNLTAAELRALYARPVTTMTQPYVRINAISSLDGGCSINGLSGELGNTNDQQIFSILRQLSDVIVVGAATAIAENYQPVPAPQQLVIVSRSLNFPANHPCLSGALVATCSDAPAKQRQKLLARGIAVKNFGDVSVIAKNLVNYFPPTAQLLVEGGPQINALFHDQQLIDEIALTTSPKVLGGNSSRIFTNVTPQDYSRFHCAHILCDDENYLFTRWQRAVDPAVITSIK